MARIFFAMGAGFTGLAVLLGAFGAHWLPLHRPDTWQTATHYQMVHGLALLALAWAWTQWPGPWLRAAGILMVAGIVLFSGSLYAIGLSGERWLGAITPLGGVCLLLGWAAALCATLRTV